MCLDLVSNLLLEVFHDRENFFIVEGVADDLNGYGKTLGTLLCVVNCPGVAVIVLVFMTLLVLLNICDGHYSAGEASQVPNCSVLGEVRLHNIEVGDLWSLAGPHGRDDGGQVEVEPLLRNILGNGNHLFKYISHAILVLF